MIASNRDGPMAWLRAHRLDEVAPRPDARRCLTCQANTHDVRYVRKAGASVVAAPRISFSGRVEQVAGNGDGGKAFITSEFFDGVTHGLRDWEGQFRRHLARALVVAVIFVALIEASVTEVSFGGLQLTDLSLPLKLIPVYFAYTVVDVIVARVGAQTWRRVWSSTIKIKEPDACKAHLELFMLPAHPYVLSEVVDYSTVGEHKTWTRTVLSVATVGFFYAAILLLPFAFLLYCYVRLFDRNGLDDWTTWLSLALSALLTAELVVVMALGNQVK
jgi:hypothetical protein